MNSTDNTPNQSPNFAYVVIDSKLMTIEKLCTANPDGSYTIQHPYSMAKTLAEFTQKYPVTIQVLALAEDFTEGRDALNVLNQFGTKNFGFYPLTPEELQKDRFNIATVIDKVIVFTDNSNQWNKDDFKRNVEFIPCDDIYDAEKKAKSTVNKLFDPA